MEMPKRSKRISNQVVLKIIFWAELVPKSFSIKVAVAMDAANKMRYKPAALVENNLKKIFFIGLG